MLNYFYIVSTITAVFFILSAVALGVTLVLYFRVPNVQDKQGKWITIILMFMFVNAIASTYIQCVVASGNDWTQLCISGGITIYTTTNVFCWLVVLCFETWNMICKPRILEFKKKAIKIGCVTYGLFLPVILSVIPVIGHHAPGNHLKPFYPSTCLFPGIMFYYLIPLSILSLKCIVFIGLIIWTLWKKRRGVVGAQHQLHKSRFFVCLIVFLIINICMLLPKIKAILIGDFHVTLASRFIVSMEGLLMFIYLVMCRKPVRWYLIGKIACCSSVRSLYVLETEESHDHICFVNEINADNNCINTASGSVCDTDSLKISEHENDNNQGVFTI